MTEAQEKILLLGCDILKAEVRLLIDKNGWPVETRLYDSTLHCNLDQLSRHLRRALHRSRGQRTIVFYGSCHPQMQSILAQEGTLRCNGQNCIEMLLGKEVFTEELRGGAFFLLEGWAHDWQRVISRTFHTKKLEVIREIFDSCHQDILCVRTPCSGDFAAEAAEAAHVVNLPIRWMDTSLDHLEGVLQDAISRKMEEPV